MNRLFAKLWQKGEKRYLLILPLIGLLILVLLVKNKSAPQLKIGLDLAPLVEAEVAQVRPLAVVISGYGRAIAKETWQAVAEVSGRVIYRHPDLEKGGVLTKGTLALKIDPVDYQLKLAQAKSDLNSAIADAARIELNKHKQQLSLALENSRLAIMVKELERKKGLLKQNSISRSQVDQEQNTVYAQQQKVLDLDTGVKLIPNDIEVAKAKIQVNESRVEEAERKLAKTEIVIPFDARITAVNAEPEQVINQQAILISANQLGAMEITAQFSVTDIKQLIRQSVGNMDFQTAKFPDIKKLDLKAMINSYSTDAIQQWQGEVTRVGDSIDVQGNTVSLVVEMSNDWQHFDPINHPPLINDAFVQTNVSSKVELVLSIPTLAIHGQSVYVVNDHQLVKKPVSVLFESGHYSAIDSDLAGTVQAGELVVTTDILPAISGMALRVATPAQTPVQHGELTK